jgi:hypothetical protein
MLDVVVSVNIAIAQLSFIFPEVSYFDCLLVGFLIGPRRFSIIVKFNLLRVSITHPDFYKDIKIQNLQFVR